MRIGCCSDMERYEELCELGYDFIELPAAPLFGRKEHEVLEIKKRLDAGKTKCESLNFYCNKSLVFVGPERSVRQICEYAKSVCGNAAVLGVKYIGIGAPESRIIPDGCSYERARIQCARALETTALEAEQYGIEVLFEPINKYYCNFMNGIPETVEFLEDLKEFNIGMVLDFCHMYLMEEDLQLIESAKPYIKHVHIGHQEKEGTRYHLTEEDVPWVKEALQALFSIGYQGNISLEVGPKEDFYKEAGMSLKILRNIAAMQN